MPSHAQNSIEIELRQRRCGDFRQQADVEQTRRAPHSARKGILPLQDGHVVGQRVADENCRSDEPLEIGNHVLECGRADDISSR